MAIRRGPFSGCSAAIWGTTLPLEGGNMENEEEHVEQLEDMTILDNLTAVAVAVIIALTIALMLGATIMVWRSVLA